MKPTEVHDAASSARVDARGMLFVYLGPTLLGLLCLVAYGLHVNGVFGKDFAMFHVPEINHFIAHPLGFETAPPSASAIPGYHWFQGILLRLTGHDRVPDGASIIRLLHTAIGVFGFGLLAYLLTKLARDTATAVLLSLLLCLSYYPLQMSYYSNTEAPAFLFFVAIIALCEQKQPDRLRGAEIGSCALAMVLMRDSMACTLPVPLAVLAARRSWWQAGIFCLYAIVAVLVIYSYWVKWGGLTSPYWQAEAFPSGGASFTPTSALHVFALTGLFSAFLVAPLYREFLFARTHLFFWLSVLALAAAVGALWWVAPSTYNPAANRRYSIIWTLASLTPSIGDSSPIVLALALAAVPMLGLMVSRMIRDRVIYPDTAMSATYLAGQFVANLPWQRYIEVPILVALGLFTARFASGPAPARLSLAALVAVYCTASVIRFLFGT
jgi:hypothetical protein